MLKPAVARLLRAGRLLDAVELVDAALLTDSGRVSADDIDAVRRAREDPARRRTVRDEVAAEANPAKEGPANERTAKEGSAKEGSVKEGSVKEGSAKEKAWVLFDRIVADAAPDGEHTNPWFIDLDGSLRYAPDFETLVRLLGVPLHLGAASRTGVPALALDVWLSFELRRAGFDPDASWPRPVHPRSFPVPSRAFSPRFRSRNAPRSTTGSPDPRRSPG